MAEITHLIPDLEAQNRGPSTSGSGDKETTYKLEPVPPTTPEGDGRHNGAPSVPNEPRKTHDDDDEYGDSAARFWSVYVDEAKNHDKAVETWKDDMEGILIFAGLYSASLTAFLVESYKKLTPDLNDVNAYYAQQSVTLLAQISAQLAASGSNVRINIFWFMSLVFSFTAALAATLVQQWVRNYMHVFQRYNHPLKCARIREFLYEGTKKWYMAVVVDAVPALIHISLFLFFLGLAEFLFKLNTATATTTTTMILICALLYIWSIIAPVHDPQSPYQSPLSGVFWCLSQLIRRRTYKDHTDGEQKLISMNMTEGRVQLAMDETDDRMTRDAKAINWVMNTLTEDSELEPFVLGIPGSFNSTWGKKVWDTVAESKNNGNGHSHAIDQPDLALVNQNAISTTTPTTHPKSPLHDLGGRITRLLKTCADPGILPTNDARRKRARACVDATLSLVLSMDHEWEWWAESERMVQILNYLGDVEKIREAPASGFESTFAVRWTCMSMIAVKKVLQTAAVSDAAQRVISCLAAVRGEKDGNADDVAAKTVGTIDQYLKSGWDSALTLHFELTREVEPDKAEKRLHEIMQNNKVEIAELEYTWNILGWAKEIDEAIITLVSTVMDATGGVLDYLPHIVSQWQPDSRRTPYQGMSPTPTYLMPQFIPPRFLIQRLWLCVWGFRNISASGWSVQPQTLVELIAPELRVDDLRELMEDDMQSPIEVQLWRMQDLRDGGLVFMLELFIATIRSGKAASHLSSPALYIHTFRKITADWKEHRDKIWTQRLLVNLLRRVLPVGSWSVEEVPSSIIDEFLPFVAKVLAEKKGSHVKRAISLITSYNDLFDGKQHKIAQEALSTISPPKTPRTLRTRHSDPRPAAW
ncbi:hypothetical protein BJV74DRAFT_799460 [Russula compacta]|nr:hypothetical protein BJV74DRAFT_799460 [Russula compacta]